MQNIDVTAESGSGKTNALLNLIKIKDDNRYSIIDKIVKDPNEAEYQYLVKKREETLLKI